MAERLHTASNAQLASPVTSVKIRQVEGVRSTVAGIDCLLRTVADNLANFNSRMRVEGIAAARYADGGEWEEFDTLLDVARDQLRRIVEICSHEDAPVN